jgi:hypothetical protein
MQTPHSCGACRPILDHPDLNRILGDSGRRAETDGRGAYAGRRSNGYLGPPPRFGDSSVLRAGAVS